MNPRLSRLYLVCVPLLLGLAACGKHAEEEVSKTVAASASKAPLPAADDVTIPADSPKINQIRVQAVEQANVTADQVVVPGKVELNPNRVSHVVLPLAGRVAMVSARVGDFVQKGQPILSVESPDIDVAISALQQAEAALIQTRAAQAKAQADMDRTKDLFDHNAIAQKEVVNSESVLAQARAAVDQAQASVQQSKRRLEIFGVQPGQFGQRTIVRSPISGKVLEISVVEGEYRNDTSASLMTIADLSTVWVSAEVPETSIRLIEVGERVQIELSAYPGEMFTGKVTQIADMVDPQSRTIEVRAEIENSKGRLRPEMFGQVRHIDRTEMRPVVPNSAVLQEEGRTSVWLEKAPGQFHRTTVELGPRTGDRQAVLSGLKTGDRIVVDGAMLLKAR
jgi:membrane fusion protein, heavy metal efflux system